MDEAEPGGVVVGADVVVLREGEVEVVEGAGVEVADAAITTSTLEATAAVHRVGNSLGTVRRTRSSS